MKCRLATVATKEGDTAVALTNFILLKKKPRTNARSEGPATELGAPTALSGRRAVLRAANQGVGGTAELETTLELRGRRAVVE